MDTMFRRRNGSTLGLVKANRQRRGLAPSPLVTLSLLINFFTSFGIPRGFIQQLQKEHRTMSAPAKKQIDYPKETQGSKLASEIRKKANTLNDAQRENLFKRGMQIINGGAGKATRTRH
jgi:hypothetical protein